MANTTPKLTMFNAITGFREAMTFVGMAAEDEETRVHLETYIDDESGLVYMRMTSENGIQVTVDATLKSECMDSDAYVRLKDLYVICDKGVKEGILAMWTDGGRLYVGSSFNEQFEGFESECSLPFTEPFDIDLSFDAQESFEFEQTAMAVVADSCFNFDVMEIVRNDGLVSFRTGNDRVTVATVMLDAGEKQGEPGRDFAIGMPIQLFNLLPIVVTAPMCKFDIDWDRGLIRSAGKTYSVTYKFWKGKLRSESTEGMKEYMKFDSENMMATIDMIYGVNYKDPIAPVRLAPVDETTMGFEFSYGDRYSGIITVPGVKVFDKEKSIVLPMDVSTMMVRSAGAKVLTMLYGEDGRLFLTFANGKYARKCMYFGG